MLEASDTQTLDTAPTQDSTQVLARRIERLQAELKFSQTKIEALNFEIARLKRWRFGSSSESLDSTTQVVLFDALVADTLLEDLAALDEIKTARPAPRAKGQAVRQALPANLPRVERHHEIKQTHCTCGQAFKRIGEEVSEQLDCVPAQFFVLRHIRGKYACACCQTIQAAPMPAQMIDKGLAASGLMAQVTVAKLDDHLPLYRQTEIYARSGVHIARSSMAGATQGPLRDPLDRRVRAAPGASGRGPEGVHPLPPRDPRRRDAGGAARTRQGQDEEGLCVGVPHDQLHGPARGVLRLLQ